MNYRNAVGTFRKLRNIHIVTKTFSSKVPLSPVVTLEKQQSSNEEIIVDKNTIALLERLSLVKTDTVVGIKILEDSIAFADKILHINTDNVQPLYSVLEERNLNLRSDEVKQGNCQRDILKNASVKEDDYFVAPMGNIPLHEVSVDENSSKMIMTNVYVTWLQSIHTKTHKHMPVHIMKSFVEFNYTKNSKLPFGIIQDFVPGSGKDTILDHKLTEYAPENKTEIKFKLVLPKEDVMKYFIQWQRYRKYWWSSITTTPSLFAINDIKQGDTQANVDIVAQLPCGPQTVEHIEVKTNDEICKNSSCLTCVTTLEGALFIVLLDGLTNNTKEEYLRLHRKIAPYKMSFALDCEELKQKKTLFELATMLYHRLQSNNISAWLPNYSASLESQIKENLLMGVPYTAILSESTLEDGIFHLMNSSTMLKEQLHVADFHSYAALISGIK